MRGRDNSRIAEREDTEEWLDGLDDLPPSPPGDDGQNADDVGPDPEPKSDPDAGRRYRKMRVDAGLRQADIAYLVGGVRQSIISEVENGKYLYLDASGPRSKRDPYLPPSPTLRERLDTLCNETPDTLRERIELDRIEVAEGVFTSDGDRRSDPRYRDFMKLPKSSVRGSYKRR